MEWVHEENEVNWEAELCFIQGIKHDGVCYVRKIINGVERCDLMQSEEKLPPQSWLLFNIVYKYLIINDYLTIIMKYLILT